MAGPRLLLISLPLAILFISNCCTKVKCLKRVLLGGVPLISAKIWLFGETTAEIGVKVRGEGVRYLVRPGDAPQRQEWVTHVEALDRPGEAQALEGRLHGGEVLGVEPVVQAQGHHDLHHELK